MARVKQGKLPGMEEPSIPELDDAAEIYDKVMRRRVKLSNEEKEAKQSLLEKMLTHNIERYVVGNGKKVVVVTAKNSVRLTDKDEEGDIDETEEEEEE